MIRTVAFFLAVALCTAQSLNGPVAAVEFYGSAPVDFTRLRTAFPIRVGDAFEIGEAELDADRTMLEFAQLVGDNRYSIAPVFVPGLKGWVVYVDVEPPANSTPVWNPEPAGAASLPAEIVALYEHSMHRFGDGGIFAGGETAEGYFLSKDPIMRADQLRLIDYARAHTADIYRALENSASPGDRIAAAWIAGYAPKDKKQIAALLQAVNDPDSTVRNNAVRVLAVLAEHDAGIARQIPADPFIPMLNSDTWTDRNKAMWVLQPITAARDPKTLESLRRQAITPLRQMSRWTYWDHASMALVLLGRVAGIPEERLQSLLTARDAAAILEAAGGE